MALAFTPIITVGKAAYLNTLKDGIWKIVGLDWDTSEQIADITLPSTYRINTCSSSPPSRCTISSPDARSGHF
jgi:hypothetical protein